LVKVVRATLESPNTTETWLVAQGRAPFLAPQKSKVVVVVPVLPAQLKREDLVED
jgi:hypothetical protein